MIASLAELTPRIGASVFVAPDAWVIADVQLGDFVSVFFGAVLRGDVNPIVVGAETNIQEHCLVHSTAGRSPVKIGSRCTLGHKAIIHGASIGDRVLIGMGATVLDDSEIAEDSLLAAGSLVPPGKRFPRGSLIMGSPAKVVRELTEAEIDSIALSAAGYVETQSRYRGQFASSQQF